MNFKLKTVPVGMLQCNCQILVCPETGSAAVIDPGDQAAEIKNAIDQVAAELGKPVRVECLLHTHAHFDHFGATRDLRESAETCHSSKICLHEDDHFIYTRLQEQGQLFGYQFRAPLAVDRFLQDNEILNIGKLRLSVLHTPGHSPGGICYLLHEDSSLKIPEVLFSGDTLFQESVGRTDLWGGDERVLKRSIQERLFVLDSDTLVWPGHGSETSIGWEKKNNPFVGV